LAENTISTAIEDTSPTPEYVIRSVFEAFKNITVAVLGDVMLDSYLWGQVDRISPEAPVPIVHIQKEELRLGGAANVALNLASLGADVHLFSVAGKDSYGSAFIELLEEHKISAQHILLSHERPTTRKTRIMARNQQVMRLDNEISEGLPEALEVLILDNLETFFKTQKPRLLILEDYNKGVLTPKIIEQAIRLATQYGVLTAVDPKHQNFFLYKGVTIFKPNLGEIKTALNLTQLKTITLDTLSSMHEGLFKQLGHLYSLFTLSEKGVFYQKNEDMPKLIPAKIRNIADVSGAGDTVIAVISLVFALTGDMALSAELGNIAGGLVCEQVGTVAIDKDLLLQEALKHL